MKKRLTALLILCLVLTLLATGCGKEPAEETTAPVETTEETLPPPTAPADGNPNDVTCQGSYSAEREELTSAASAVVARIGEEQLTVARLQHYYWMEIAEFRQAGGEGPDFSQGLDTQLCDLDDTAVTWQQYFLQRALDTWHAHQALVLWGQEEGAPTEEAYERNEARHEEYMTDKPATKVLYGYNKPFKPNTMHQAYLDEIPAMLETLAAEKGFTGVDALAEDMAGAAADSESLSWYTDLSNRGYMYFTELHYDIRPTDADVEAWFADHEQAYAEAGITRDGEKTVNVRHILLVPGTEEVPSWVAPDPELATLSIAEDGTVTCSEALWEKCYTRAENLIKEWSWNWERSEYTFADMAHKESADPGSNINGGLYTGVRKGQLAPELDAWCFDEARQPGDMEIIRTAWGYHVMYFSGTNEQWYETAKADWVADRDAAVIREAKEKYPMKVDYSAIALGSAENTAAVTASGNLLYADVAHQRYPEVPLFLQQDYPNTMYGNFKITTHGCGITTMAMVASYFADDAMFPPKMCEEYDDYCYVSGTDGSLFVEAPAEMNFYLKKMTYNCNEAKEALDQGHLVVVLQHKGYWTRGGHYLVLEKELGDDMIQVRDSNIFNYGRLQRHKEDSFPWYTITPNGMGYWIFEFKRTSIPVCTRCGDENTEGIREGLLTGDYFCEKCNTAMARRSNYIQLCTE